MENIQTADHSAAPFQPLATFEELKCTLDGHHAANGMNNVGERLACMILSVEESRLREIVASWKEEDWQDAELGEGGPVQPLLDALESLTIRRTLVDEALRRMILVLDADSHDDEGALLNSC